MAFDKKAYMKKYNKQYNEKNREKKKQYDKQYREANKEKVAEKKKKYNKQYNEKNREKLSEYQRQYREANKEKVAEKKKKYNKQYNEANPGKRSAHTAKRRAARIQRTPKWLTKEDHKIIEGFYIEARRLTKETGILHHVDHIVPLQGKNVSGLHVPSNLQIITAEENLKKSNTFNTKQIPTHVSNFASLGKNTNQGQNMNNYNTLKADFLRDARNKVKLPTNDKEACKAIIKELEPFFTTHGGSEITRYDLFNLIAGVPEDTLYELLDGLAQEYTDYDNWTDLTGLSSDFDAQFYGE